MDMEMCRPDPLQERICCPSCWGCCQQAAVSRQLSAPLGIFSAAEHHPTQGQTFPRAVHIQWLMGSLGRVVTWYPMVKLAVFSVTWCMARTFFLGVECDAFRMWRILPSVFLLFGSHCMIQEFVFYFRGYVPRCPWPVCPEELYWSDRSLNFCRFLFPTFWSTFAIWRLQNTTH